MTRRALFIFIILISFSCDKGKEFEVELLKSKVNRLEEENRILNDENSKLRVELNKKNIDSDQKKNTSSPKIVGNQIGKWKTPSAYGGGFIEIFITGDKYFKVESFVDGSNFKVELKLETQNENLIFSNKSTNSPDRWVVLKNGTLEVRDNLGPIFTSEKM
jgi:regulator of replication initiation timing